MQAVILAAGEGTRLRPLTNETPKALIPVAGMPIIKHTLNSLPDEITEIIFVIGNKGEQIKNYIGNLPYARSVVYVEGVEPKGTGYALAAARSRISGPFLLLNGDDIYGKEDLRALIAGGPAILAAESSTPERFGVCEVKDNLLSGIVEKPKNPLGNLVNIGAYFLNERIFDVPVKKLPNGEWNLAEQVSDFAHIYPLMVYRARLWYPINTHEELKKADAALGAPR